MNRSTTNRALIVVNIICAALMAVSGSYGVMSINLVAFALLTYVEAST